MPAIAMWRQVGERLFCTVDVLKISDYIWEQASNLQRTDRQCYLLPSQQGCSSLPFSYRVSPLVCFIPSIPAKEDKPREQQHPLTGLARPSLTLQGKKAPKLSWMVQKWEAFGFVLFCLFIGDSCRFLPSFWAFEIYVDWFLLHHKACSFF